MSGKGSFQTLLQTPGIVACGQVKAAGLVAVSSGDGGVYHFSRHYYTVPFEVKLERASEKSPG